MRALIPLLLLPLLEIAGFVWVGGAIGAGGTIALTLATAVLGLVLLRANGVDTLRRAQARLQAGEPPLREAFDGLCLALAGVLLFIPGFFTDAAGLLLFLPPVRDLLYRRAARMVVPPGGTIHRNMGSGPGGPDRRTGTVIIETEWREADGGDTSPHPALEDNRDDLPPPEDSRWRPDPDGHRDGR